VPDPVDSKGRTINGSTYERVSWFIKGVQLIQENPLGNGISHLAFGHYMRSENPKSMAVMTHSAWIDFTLGLGLPGLLLVWAAILGLILRSINLNRGSSPNHLDVSCHSSMAKELVSSIAIWLVLGMFFFWIVGEVSEREYIEHYFFLIALFAMGLAPTEAKR
jgi:O-antigen ligase